MRFGTDVLTKKYQLQDVSKVVVVSTG